MILSKIKCRLAEWSTEKMSLAKPSRENGTSLSVQGRVHQSILDQERPNRWCYQHKSLILVLSTWILLIGPPVFLQTSTPLFAFSFVSFLHFLKKFPSEQRLVKSPEKFYTNRTVSPSAFAQLFHNDVVFVLVFENDGDYVKYFNFPFAWTVSFFFKIFFFSLFSLFELLWCKIHVGKLKLQNFENFRAAFISDINI